MWRKYTYLRLQNAFESRLEEYYREFKQLEHCRPEQLRSLQEQRLERILAHSAANVPFYRERVPWRMNYTLEDFPVLTKSDIRREFRRLMSDSFRRRYDDGERPDLKTWMRVSTSGSTGEPTITIHDKEMRERGRAGRLYAQELYGFPFGTPHYKLWGDIVAVDHHKNSLTRRAQNFLSGGRYLNAFFMDCEHCAEYLELINRSSIDYMIAFVDAAIQLARYAVKHNIKVRPLKTIVTSSGTLTEETRQLLKEVFGAEIRNQYGSAECTNIAVECGRHGFHIYSNQVCLESVGPDRASLPPDRTGEMLVTLLFNYSFPLIRFEIGDIGTLRGGDCECGRPFPLLEKVAGRELEFLNTPDGGYISPSCINSLVGVHYNYGFVRRYQLVQNDRARFELKLEIEPGTSPELYAEVTGKLREKLEKVLGAGAELAISRVERIPERGNGKFLYTLNLMKLQENGVLAGAGRKHAN